MKTDDRVLNVIESGIAPISLSFSEVTRFDEKPSILRSALSINSLSLGVLTFVQYRYIVGRYKRGTELFSRHTEKLFEWLSEKDRKVKAVTLPVISSALLSGAAARALFDAFAKYPKVSSESILLEVSADILFEDSEKVRACIEEINALGVRIAVFEAGNEYCPLMRLSELGAKYIFVDPYAIKGLTADNESAGGLPAMLHSGGAEVFAPNLSGEAEIAAAKAAGYDGYLVSGEVMMDE